MDTKRAFELVLLAVSGGITVYLFLPYVTVVLASVFLAYLLGPLYRRLVPRIGEKAAGIGLIFATIVILVIPFILLFNVAVTGLRSLLSSLQLDSIDGLAGLLESTFGTDFGVGESVRELAQGIELGTVLQRLLDTLGGLSSAFIRLTILLFLTYYLLKSGDDLIAWVEDLIPLSPETTTSLFERADKLLFAVIVGNTLIAVADGLLVGLGLFLTGFTDILFWTVLSMFLALIPLVGTTVIWIPAAVYLVIIGDVGAGVILFLYGAVIVGSVDNILRPYVGASEVGLTPPMFIFGVFSGLTLFGFMGVYFGPVILAMTKMIYETVGKNLSRRDAAA